MRKRCIRRTMRRFLHGSERCTRIFDCFCLLWAKRVNPLLLASLFSDFSESKKSQKIFAAQTPPRKRGYGRISPDKTHFAPPKAQKLSFRTVHKTVMRNRRATGARICGSVRSKTIFGKSVIFHITQTVNRTYFYNQLAVAR